MNRFKNLLCVLDPWEPDAALLERALALAGENQATLTVAAVVDLGEEEGLLRRWFGLADPRAEVTRERTRFLEAFVAGRGEGPAPEVRVLTGRRYLEVIREVIRGGRDLVLTLPGSPTWSTRWMGSDELHLLRKCPCPVWLFRPRTQGFRNILAALDLGPASMGTETPEQGTLNQWVLELAASLALSEFAQLHLVHAYDAPGEALFRHHALAPSPEEQARYRSEVATRRSAALGQVMERLREHIGGEALDYLRPQARLLEGAPAEAVPQYAQTHGVDLVVMGTVARTGIPGLIIGNTAETLLHRLECSVLAVKPPGFVSPVAAGA